MELRTDIAADPVTKRGRKMRRLLTAGHLDRRTRGVKRARTIAAELERGWDGITPVQRQAIGRAAMWCAIAEDLAARRLAGQLVPLDDVLRAEGVAKRAVKAVLAERPEPPPAPRFSPMKVLREEAAKKAQANAGTEAQREATTDEEPLHEHPAQPAE
jgi:hypothetical protein